MTFLQRSGWQRIAWVLVVFSFGLFSISAQALLFREFVSSLEGHDIAVGLFLAFWLTWVAIGAGTWRLLNRLTTRWLGQDWVVGLCVLMYIPASAIELLLMLSVRELAGIKAYALIGLGRLLFWTFIVCGPVSLVTGLVFPMLCRWVARQGRWPITAVYVLESAGSLVGGALTTVLLAVGWTAAGVWLVVWGLLAGLTGIAIFKSRPRWVSGIAVSIAGLCIFGLVGSLDSRLSRYIQLTRWSSLLPAQSFGGAFGTARGEYLYGTYHGQFMVIRDRYVVDALPQSDGTRQLAAIAIAQRPQTRRVLVVDTGLSLSRALLSIDTIEYCGLVCLDPQYPYLIDRYLPSELAGGDRRLQIIATDIRSYLRQTSIEFDLMIIGQVGTINAATSRLYTKEFFDLARVRLGQDGVLVAAIPGGENVIGAELAYLGASIIGTVKEVFGNWQIIPGERTIIFGSDGQLTSQPDAIRQNLKKVDPEGEVYPADALASQIQPARIQKAVELYEEVLNYTGQIVNRDTHPIGQLYGLLLTARQAGLNVLGASQRAAHLGLWLLVVPVGAVVVLRLIYLLSHRQANGQFGAFVPGFAIFCAGFAGITTVIILLSIHQAKFGTLYIYMGLVSGLFMAGLCIGAILMQYLLLKAPVRWTFIGLVLVHTCLLIWITRLAGIADPGVGLLALAFLLVGICSGGYMPWAAHVAVSQGWEVGMAASRLELLDHAGAAIGGLGASLVLLPPIGLIKTLVGLCVLLCANIPLQLLSQVRIRTQQTTPMALLDLRFRRAGYMLFGIASCCIVWSYLVWQPVRMEGDGGGLAEIAAQWTKGMEVAAQASLAPDGTRVEYLKVSQSGRLKGYIFSTERFLKVRGYGGPLAMVIFVDPNGGLIDQRFTRCSETPRYFNRVVNWLAGLRGVRLWGQDVLKDVHAVTGATISSNAVLALLRTSGQAFAKNVLRLDMAQAQPAFHTWDNQGIYLLAALLAAIVASISARKAVRTIVLAGTCVIGGFILNSQYSTENVMALLWGRVSGLGLNGVFILAMMPLVVAVFGNLYCGYICPFGALQELISYLLPGRFRPTVARSAIQKARFVKYAVLFAFVVGFCLTADKAVYGRDPLLSFFDWRAWGQGWQRIGLVLFGMFLVAILLFRRFWCRYVCPAGAFLSLFNHLAILGKRVLPAKRFGCCEFGLTGLDRLDCIWCDRCRNSSGQPAGKGKAWSKVLVVTAIAAGLWLLAGAWEGKKVAVAEQVGPQTGQVRPAQVPRQPSGRTVDMERVKAMIQQGQLSDKEAMYYIQLDQQE